MRNTRYTLLAAAIIAIAVSSLVYTQAYQPNTLGPRQEVMPSPTFGPQPPNLKPSGVNVTLAGILRGTSVAPTCGISNHPCAEINIPIYYLSINGWNYRLLFPNSISPPDLLGQRVLVTGLYITPSSFDSTQWTPSISFHGDIYIQTVIYLHYFLSYASS